MGEYIISREVLSDVEFHSKELLRDESADVISSTVAAMVATLHEFGDNLPDFREFEKQIEFDGGEYRPPSHCLSFNAVVPPGEEDELESEQVDRYGFYVTDKYRRAQTQVNSQDERKEHERTVKWQEMISQWDRFPIAKLKERVRKGVPNAMRGQVWPLLLDIDTWRAKWPVDMVSRMVVNLDVRIIDEIDR